MAPRFRALFCLLPLLPLLLPALAHAQQTTKLSRNWVGENGDAPSELGDAPDALTPDGRFCAFTSAAYNLVPGDSNGYRDVLLHDRVSGTLERVSLTSSGIEPVGDSQHPALSDDGRFVAFQSLAPNLAAGDWNGTWDVFITDRVTRLTTIVSAAANGTIGNGASVQPSISGDGTRIAFASSASNLVANDTNGAQDVFVRNLQTGTVRLVSRLPQGALGNANSRRPAISGDGQWVAFESLSTNLVAGSASNGASILLASLASGGIELVSVSNTGVPANNSSSAPCISRDGSRVAFLSRASNLALVAQFSNNAFLRDRASGSVMLVSASADGLPATAASVSISLSDNGNFVAHASPAPLTPGHSGNGFDAFLFETSSRRTIRTSVPLVVPGEPNQTGVNEVAGVSDDGIWTAFAASSSNLIPGELPDATPDVFLRDTRTAWFRDRDLDRWGLASESLLVPFPQGLDYALSSGDCDDTRAAVNPAATEICNGLDDDCDGLVDELAWFTYCTAGTSQAGCVPALSTLGFPSASRTSGFELRTSGLPGQRQAVAMYSLALTNIVWTFGSTSTVCVASPLARLGNLPTGGTLGQCNGSYAVDWLAYMAANPGALGQPLAAGRSYYAQLWYRDPGAPLNSNLTNAVSFTLCP